MMTGNEAKSEIKWVLAWAAVIAVLASLPYAWGMRLAPPGYHFLGLTHNIDDGAVYLSWLRQIADGHILFHNLFTTEPTPAGQFNILFLLMGSMAAAGVPLIVVFHVFRVLLGFGLIVVIWQFSKLFLREAAARRILIPLVGLSSGIGWLLPTLEVPNAPVDMWQPEAITFLSIYLNPLFLAGLILIVGAFHFLLVMSCSGRAKHAVCAGLSMFLLANIHTYDLVSVACVWAGYLAVRAISERRVPTRAILLSLLAGAMAIPPIAYQLYLYHIDPIFRARANSPAPSPAIWFYFAGYGLVLLGAVVGATIVGRALRGPDTHHPAPGTRFLLVWCIVGFALPYLPVAQQRKLVMGLHIPLCILCAYALSVLIVRVPKPLARSVLLGFVLFCAGSNVRFLALDTRLLSVGRTVTTYAPFMSDSELAAMRFLRGDPNADHAVYAPPTFALFTPAFTGHRVYYGHWSETPDYTARIQEWMDFVNPAAPDDFRADVLRGTGAGYYVSTDPAASPPKVILGHGLSPAFSQDGVTVYRMDFHGSHSR